VNVARTYKTLSLSLPPDAVQELAMRGRRMKCTGARAAALIVLREIEDRSRPQEEGSGRNRHCLTTLVAAGAKLDIAARLVREAIAAVAGSGLLPLEEAKKIPLDIDAYLRRVSSAIELIPCDEGDRDP
jgi:hypothetical protein